MSGQVDSYSVTLTPDFQKHILRGDERIEFRHDAGPVERHKQPGLLIRDAKIGGGFITALDPSVRIQLRSSGDHVFRASYTAAEGRGLHWFDGANGFATAFYCEAWMICDNTPGQRATLRLELVLPSAGDLRPAGPGRLTREWKDAAGKHYLFEQKVPVQTYLFSFAVAPLAVSSEGNFTMLTAPGEHKAVFRQTEMAYQFLRSKAAVDPINRRYTQVFLKGPSIGQEAAGQALLSEDDLSGIEKKDDVWLMAHELAHQWWGALVGIRSWSDFWLNEGMASFMADAYLEQHQGRWAYDAKISEARERMEKLRAAGKDRPLHWEHWKDAHDALGAIPYVKGTLVLDRLRTLLGDALFWRGIRLYTSKYAHRLVDSHDFEQAMEEASGRDLKAFFDEAVYR